MLGNTKLIYQAISVGKQLYIMRIALSEDFMTPIIVDYTGLNINCMGVQVDCTFNV